MGPVGSRRSTSTIITPKQLEEIQHRHQLQMALIKQEARELKEDKAYLVAQNLCLERELSRQNQSFGHGAAAGVFEQRRTDINARPSFHRSRSQPNADLRDPHHPLCLSSPTCSGSSCSSRPWVSSGGTNTPSSQSPRSRHSRNASSVSIGVPPTLSRRPSTSGTGASVASAPDPAVLLHRLPLASRQQKLAHPQNTLNPMRPLSVSSAVCDDSRPNLSCSNPGSRAASRRNSLSAGSGHDHPPPLKGILKPSTPIRPLSSCSNTVVVPPPRPSTGKGYYFDEAYDSITHPNGKRTVSSVFNQAVYPPQPPDHIRSRRASMEAINGAGERMKYNHGGYF